MTKLTQQQKPFAQTKIYSGTYTCDASLWEDEYVEESFDYTIAVSEDLDNRCITDMTITWEDAVPRNVEEVEAEIKRLYDDQHS